ncbi:hypothetical protein BG011_005623 [Mortierella polycephala]|uniref:NADH dehydrogenase [ubiquinone] 1 alpha subcomplex assembly factor 3 n=1 Tax=Mortierella polycephala TaxID=41804 RepID=A0A9P6U126_9FUNG|nr:hypothetical protein BG011_005623 [Mortierella polycephala]
MTIAARLGSSLRRTLATHPFTAAVAATSTRPAQLAYLSQRSFTSHSPHQQQQHQQQQHAQKKNQPLQFVEGLRQKDIPNAGANEDADSAISGFMNMFNDKDSKTVSITTCTKHGFVTTDAITLQGPVLCIGGQVFLWDIFKQGGAVDRLLNKENSKDAPTSTAGSTTLPARSVLETMDEPTAREIFKIFELMNPRPEILIVGTGKLFAPLSPSVRSVIRNLGLQVDMMSTANAAATYNMLAEEGREVAAALLPLEPATVQVVNSKHQ